MARHDLKILVIDDNEQIRRSLRAIFTAKGYQVVLAESGEEGLTAAVEELPDLVTLDLSMPGMTGFAVCEALRQWYTNPIIVISVLEREADIITALKMGADDYITKPYSIGVLLARVEAHLRRVETTRTPLLPKQFSTGRFLMDYEQHRVFLDDCEIELTPTEFNILTLLTRHPNCVVTNQMILTQVWKESDYATTQNLRVHMSNLRRKLMPTPESPQILSTEFGVGFRFVME